MNKYFIDEEIRTVNGSTAYVYRVHGEHCASQEFTSYYEAERYIRLMTGYYGVDENRKIYQRWTFDDKGHLIK